jgi:hypothetical protein
MSPKRIQRSRAKGWKMPGGAVYVGRPTWWGNPFTPDRYFDCGYSGNEYIALKACVQAYREWLTFADFTLSWGEATAWLEACRQGRVNRLPELRGKDLACWCPLDRPCHADVLLEIANA